MEEVRLQKFLANQGVCSRRKAEEYIQQGLVKVNGETVTELGTKINPEKDEVIFKGNKVGKVDKKVYILLNKPIGYVTTTTDQFGRDTVIDLVKVKEKVLPVGRLDMYTSGALILTNDGEFIYKVTHPKYEIEKTKTGVNVDIHHQNLGYLIGYRGETLYAFQNILSAIAGKGINNKVRVLLDIEGYKAKRTS